MTNAGNHPSRSMRFHRRVVVAMGASFLLFPTSVLAARRTQTLFMIGRSKNANVIHYDVRLADGKLDIDEPMVAYWVMHAEDGRREALTWLERELAYGFRISSRVTNEGFRVFLKAFARRELGVRHNSDGSYRATVRIAGQKAALDRIFVNTDEGSAGPSVRFVDLFGTEESSGKRVSERLEP